MTVHPSPPSGSALRRRMIEDMSVRGFTKKTQRYLQWHPGGYRCHSVRPDWRLPPVQTFRKRQATEGSKDRAAACAANSAKGEVSLLS